MLNFEEELKKCHYSLEVDEVGDALHDRDLTDLTDLLVEMEKMRKSGKNGQE